MTPARLSGSEGFLSEKAHQAERKALKCVTASPTVRNGYACNRGQVRQESPSARPRRAGLLLASFLAAGYRADTGKSVPVACVLGTQPGPVRAGRRQLGDLGDGSGGLPGPEPRQRARPGTVVAPVAG
jgi:hypothetical protein